MHVLCSYDANGKKVPCLVFVVYRRDVVNGPLIKTTYYHYLDHGAIPKDELKCNSLFLIRCVFIVSLWARAILINCHLTLLGLFMNICNIIRCSLKLLISMLSAIMAG